MKATATLPRRAAATCLVLAAVLSVVGVELQPPFRSSYTARLAVIDQAGTSATLSAALFAWSQLPMLVALLTIAHLIRRGAPRLSNVGGGLATIGVLGHAVWGGVMLVTVVMAGDTENREVYVGLLERIESTPLLMTFAAAGLLGTVLGMLLLGVGLWRSRAVPRWLPVVLWAFLVVEFVGTNLSDYASHVGGLCLLIVFGALATEVWRVPRVTEETVTGRPTEPVPA